MATRPQQALNLRAAHASDAAEIASISRQQIEYGLNWRWTTTRVKQHIANPEVMVLVASVAGVMQGFAIMKFAEEESHLLLLAVQPKSRRTGIGTAMLNWLEKSCRTAGIEQVRVEVRASNPPARKFYERRGYRLIGELSGYYDRREAALVMARRVNEKTAT